MNLIAIDPGPIQSAWVVRRNGVMLHHGTTENRLFLPIIEGHALMNDPRFAIEQIRSYGMPVGAEVFDTCEWSGRFIQAWITTAKSDKVQKIPRKEICAHLCGSARAKDANIRQSCMDRVGPIGTKLNPGPTHGIVKDEWSALAVALVAEDRIRMGIV